MVMSKADEGASESEADIEALQREVRNLRRTVQLLDARLHQAEQTIRTLEMRVANVADSEVHLGTGGRLE